YRVHAVDANLVGPEFGGHRLRHQDDRAFRAVVDRKPGPGAQPGGRGDVDEAAAAALSEHRHGVHGREVDALHVHGIDAVKLRFADFHVGLVAMRPAGVVHDDIEARAGGLHELCPVRALGHVRLHELSADLARYALAGRGVDVVHDDLRAFLVEAARDALAESG